MTIREFLARAAAFLADKGVDGPALCARMLVEHALGLDRTGLILAGERELSDNEERAAWALVARRGTGEPAAYIVGEKEFWGLAFAVTPEVLIPRPETEHVVERAKELFPADAPLAIADLGTGSGILAVTLACEFPAARVLAVDVSPGALAVARANARRHGVAGRILFARADMAALPAPAGSLDLVAANPPYVSEAEYAEASHEVRDFEPRGALVPDPPMQGVASGLEDVARLLPEAKTALRPGGALLMEIGCTQALAVLELIRKPGGWRKAAVRTDLAGLDRVIEAFS